MTGTSGTAIERRHSGALAEADADQRALDRLMARARILCKLPGLCRELADKPEPTAAMMISLEAENQPATILNLNSAFAWIQGRPARSTQNHAALAYRAGYEIVPIVDDSDTEAEVLVKPRNGEQPKRFRYTIDQAITAGHLDEWVEEWQKKRVRDDGTWKEKNFLTRYVIRRNGEAVGEPYPDWVQAAIDAGQVKRKDAWFNYRSDMNYKSVVVRAIRRSCPHVLAGLSNDDPVPGDRTDYDDIPVDDSADEPVDGEVIGDEPEELVGNAAAKHEVLDRYKAIGVDEDKAKTLAHLLWRSHRLPDGEPIPRRRLDNLLSVFDEKPSAARADPPVVVDEDTGEVIPQDDQPETEPEPEPAMVVHSETLGPERQSSFLDDNPDDGRPFD